MSGWARVVRDAACRQARIVKCDVSDLYVQAYIFAADLHCGWARQCKAVMEPYGVLPWATWCSTCSSTSLSAYKAYVTQQLAGSEMSTWLVAVSKHSAHVPYNLFQRSPSCEYANIVQSDLSWKHQLKVRAWSQLRAGLLVFRHLNGQRSQDRYQTCIFCNKPGVRNSTKHVVSKCRLWSAFHAQLRELMECLECTDDEFVLRVLSCGSSDAAFLCVLDLAHMVSDKCAEFWARR